MRTRPSDAPDRLRLRVVEVGLAVALALLVLVLVAIARAPYFHGGPGWIALLALPGVIPLAGVMATERELRRPTATRATPFATLAFFACVITAVPYLALWDLAENGGGFS
jgi:hypothetical protein